ncbi:MAG: DUF1566 domain-containing protein, partial [Deltaproteobacteria bacterium]|nr:DUF1566 domain-containing protein [Deltaproteobacteria bacterium]
PERRQQEAEAALSQMKGKEEAKYAEVDRHIQIHFSKGHITRQEIKKLAEVHRLDEEKIQERVDKYLESRFEDLDRQLGIRMAKGYITEDEVKKLAKLHGVPTSEIKKRVTCPIRKEGKAAAAEAQALEKSIEKVISENLKIVGKSSLYEFLDVSSNASLKLLQKRAKEKEKALAAIGKKDALVTASEILAGHCISLFKSEEGRNAYNVSRGRALLAKLNNDIDIAGMDGTIRTEYFKTLLKSAMDIGMDESEAREYIENYAREKGMKVEKEKKPVLNKKRMLAAAAVIVAMVVGVAAAGAIFMASQKAKSDYQNLMTAVEKAPLEKKPAIMAAYLRTHEPNKYTELVENRLSQVRKQVETQKLKDLLDRTSGLVEKGRLAEALAVFREYLAQNPGRVPSLVKERMAAIQNAMDERDYQALSGYADAPIDQRMAAYAEYLRSHPEGRHVEEVRSLIWDMSGEYYLYVEKQIDQAVEKEQWQQAIDLCTDYIGIYDNQRAYELKERRNELKNRQREEALLAAMDDKAQKLGSRFDAARAVYREYLVAYPSSLVREKIEQRLADIDAREEAARLEQEKERAREKLAAAGGRFREVSDGVVKDTKTGLFWTLLDSQVMTKKCMDYTTAQDWVNRLNIAGYENWRLPTAKELFTLFNEKPYFPSAGDKWFWTSKSYTQYSDGWGAVVEVVSGRNGSQKIKQNRDSYECLVVRPVHDPR